MSARLLWQGFSCIENYKAASSIKVQAASRQKSSELETPYSDHVCPGPPL